MKKLIFAFLFLTSPALAYDGAGWDSGSGSMVSPSGTITEIHSANVITDATLDGACGDANWTCSGTWTIATGVATRTANAANLALASKTAVSSGATGTWYRWDIETDLSAGSLAASFCGQSLGTISTTGALTTTYRVFCPYQASAVAVPTLTAVAATAGTVASMPLYPITSKVTGTSLAFEATGKMAFALGAETADFFQGSDASGITLHGYDDQVAVGAKFQANGAGGFAITGLSNSLTLQSGNGANLIFIGAGTGDFDFRVDSDTLFQVGDGSYTWQHTPGAGIETVTEIDGKAWLDGGAGITGQVTVSGTAPALTSCGTSPTITSGSSDHAGTFVIGATGTGCTLTFAADQGTATACIVGGGNAATWTSSDTALTVTAAPGAYSYVCYGL